MFFMKNNLPNKPSFTLFYWKPWEEKSNLFDSWIDYNKDLSLIDYSAEQVGAQLERISEDQLSFLGDLGESLGITIESVGNDITTKLGDSIEKGANLIAQKIESVENELSILNGKAEMLLEQSEINNLLLSDIFKVIKLPDDQKKRFFHTELGLKFLSKAKIDEDLYDDALNEFLAAEIIMPQDYFVLHKLGLIYTYSNKHLSITKALDYFQRAAKYSSLESKEGDVYFSVYLNGGNFIQDINYDLDEQDEEEDYNSDDENEEFDTTTFRRLTPAYIASDSYQKAAFCFYILGDFEASVKLQSKSINLNGTPSAHFLLSKYQARLGNISDSITSLSTALHDSPQLVKGVLKDFDFINRREILDYLEQKNQELADYINAILKSSSKTNFAGSKEKKQMLTKLLSASFEEKANFIIEYKYQLNKLKTDSQVLINSYENFDLLISDQNKKKSTNYTSNPIYSVDKKLKIEDSDFNNSLKLLAKIDDYNLYFYNELYETTSTIFESEKKKFLSTLPIKNIDILFAEAARLVVMNQQGSTSLIQRTLALGYNRAGKLMDQLECAGIVSPFDGTHARKVYVKSEEDLELLLDKCLVYEDGDYVWNPIDMQSFNKELELRNKEIEEEERRLDLEEEKSALSVKEKIKKIEQEQKMKKEKEVKDARNSMIIIFLIIFFLICFIVGFRSDYLIGNFVIAVILFFPAFILIEFIKALFKP